MHHLRFQLSITPLGSYDGRIPLDTNSPSFRTDQVITTYGQSLEPFGPDVYIGGDPADLRHLLPKPARGFVGSVRG